MNQTAKEININNIIENKNNIGCNFVNNINIYSNYLKQDNYVGNNLKKFGGNTQYKGEVKNNNSNKNDNSISYNNKLKEGKVVSSLTNNLQKKVLIIFYIINKILIYYLFYIFYKFLIYSYFIY